MQKNSRVTSLALILALFVGPLSRAQPVRPLQIQLRIVVGDNAAYEAGSLQGKTLGVEVTDEAGTPVTGVAVTFRLPEEGATGLFPDGNRSALVYTAEQGLAAVPGIKWGASPGTVSIRITAVKGSAHAGILAQQRLIAAATPIPGATPTVAPAQRVRSTPATAAPTTETKPTNTPPPV